MLTLRKSELTEEAMKCVTKNLITTNKKEKNHPYD